jgi:iron-sulfur cluster assembly protein
MITVTDQAAKKILANIAKRGSGIGIRLGVRTTGCSGMAYVLEYIDQLNIDDTVTETNGVDIIIDAKSIAYLENVTIDYVRQGLNEGFEFTNSIEKDRCGCGESFRV